MKLSQRIFINILGNFDIYLTIIISLIVALLGIIGKTDLKIVTSVILAVLALLSISLLRTRYENENIRKKFLQIEEGISLSDKVLSEYFDINKIKKTLLTAQKAIFCGISLTRVVQLLDHTIEEGLQNGLEISFVLLKPESNSAEMAAFRNLHRRDTDKVNQTLKETISRLEDLQKVASHNKGKIEIFFIDYLVPYTILVINPEHTNGFINVRLTSFRIPNEKRPSINLIASEDKIWFAFFKKQAYELLANSEQINLVS